MTRRITPHKGGRTRRAPEARLTPQEREHLDAVLEQRGGRYIDWLVDHVEQDYKQITGKSTMKSIFRKAFDEAAKQDAEALRKRGYRVTFVSEEEAEDGIGIAPGWNCIDSAGLWNMVSREAKSLGIKHPVHYTDFIELGEHCYFKCACGKLATFQKISDTGKSYVCDDHKES